MTDRPTRPVAAPQDLDPDLDPDSDLIKSDQDQDQDRDLGFPRSPQNRSSQNAVKKPQTA